MVQAKDITIVIDAGHGPGTPGKETPFIPSLGRKIQEEEFNMPVVRLLEEKLKRCGFKVIVSSNESYDVPLNTRVAIANKAKADLFISVHFNAMGHTMDYSTANGFSVHIQPGASSTSVKFAKLLVEELAKGTKQVNRGVVYQNLAVTRMTNMPAALVECGYMDDPRESLLMLNKSFQNECASEITKATCRLFGVPYVSDNVITASAPTRDYLIYGDRSPAVVQMKKDLNTVGSYGLPTYEFFNAETRAALLDFQRKQKIEADGIYGAGSRAAMKKALDSIKNAAAQKPKVEVEEVMDLSGSQKAELAAIYMHAHKTGLFSSDQHSKDVLAGTMTISKATYLNGIIAAAALNGGKRVQ